MGFKKYLHVERFGNAEVEGILDGYVYVFPKLDGTNASVWLEDGELHCGSRKREITLDNDNFGFASWVHGEGRDRLLDYLSRYPWRRLFGEWLVPHKVRAYRADAWRDFYVFDVAIDYEYSDEGERGYTLLAYGAYRDGLTEYGISWVPPMTFGTGFNLTHLEALQVDNRYLLDPDAPKGAGEGLVVKRYDFVNRYGRTTWAKWIPVRETVKPKGSRSAPGVEARIVDRYLRPELVEKAVVDLVSSEDGWRDQLIPRLLETVYHDLVVEEIWGAIRDQHSPTIDFRVFRKLAVERTKELRPDLFGGTAGPPPGAPPSTTDGSVPAPVTSGVTS